MARTAEEPVYLKGGMQGRLYASPRAYASDPAAGDGYSCTRRIVT